MIYDIYTDGAVSMNGKEEAIGAWAYIITTSDDNHFLYGVKNSGVVINATNQICELLAAQKACKAIECYLNNDDIINIISDSAYLINCYCDQWYENWLKNDWKNSKKQPVANKEIWLGLIPFFKNKQFNFIKVKGHSGHKWNEEVDKLAVETKKKGMNL